MKQEQQPAQSGATQVAGGVWRVQLPTWMPGLGHVNSYLLRDRKGVTVVDPGLPGPRSWRRLRARLQSAGVQLRDIHTVIVTHSHLDHFGGAGALVRAAGACLVTHEAFPSGWWPWQHRPPPSPSEPGPRNLGAPSGDLRGSPVGPARGRARGPWGPMTAPWGGERPRPPLGGRLLWRTSAWASRYLFGFPEPHRRMADGEVLELGEGRWMVVHTPGHTLDHVCLFDRQAGLLLSGDHVLPTITPHIPGAGPGVDPLGMFLASLERVASLEGVRLVLPGHGGPFDQLARRVEAIRRHHEERMDRLRELVALRGPATVQELSRHLFRGRQGPLAESETHAHLERLRLAGELERYEAGGRFRYTVAPRR